MNREGNVYYSCNGIKKHITSFCHGNLTTKKRKTEKKYDGAANKMNRERNVYSFCIGKKKREKGV